MWPFDEARKSPAGPPARAGQGKPPLPLTSLEQQVSAVKMAELEMRITSLEKAIVELCYGLRANLDRMDANIIQLDKNMHNLAALTLRPPKDLLGGAGTEPN